jgi:hypothetical protein
MINDVYKTVQSAANKDNNGYLTPLEFNLYAKAAQLELFEQMFHDYSRATVKRNRRGHKDGYGDVPARLSQAIETFRAEDTLTYDGVQQRFILPGNTYWVDAPFYNTTTEVEITSPNEAARQIVLLDAAPSTSYPIGVIYENENPGTYPDSNKALKVYPTSITGNIVANYIRYPEDPNWTYQTFLNGEPIFDQSQTDYQDFELPLDDYENLVIKILSYMGIQIDKYVLNQFAQYKEQNEKQFEQ